MSDLDLDLLQAWTPEPVTPSAEVRDHARARLEQAYDSLPTRLAPTSAPARTRFGRRLAIAALAVIVLLTAAIVWAQREVDDRVANIKTVTVPGDVLGGGEVGHGPVNVLVVGSDRRDGTNPEAFGSPAETGAPRSDTMILLRIDGASVRALWIPRDLVVSTAGGAERISSRFEHGPAALIDTIKHELGLSIDHYVQVDFGGFQRIVDEVGGVRIYSPGPTRDRYSGLDITGPGCRTLDGAAALSWVRSRHLEIEQDGVWQDASPHADLDRVARQQTFVRQLAAAARAKVRRDPVAAVRLADAALPALTIDSGFSREEIFGLVRALVGIDPATAQLSTLPVRPAPDGGTLVLSEPDADAALSPFKGGRAPSVPPPPVGGDGQALPSGADC